MKMRFALLAIVSLASSSIWAQLDPQKDFVATSTDAYLMLPPELICGPKVMRMDWSQDGERLAVLRVFQKMSAAEVSSSYTAGPGALDEPETQISTWNTKTDKIAMPFRLKASEGSVENLNWVAGSSSLVVEAQLTNQPSEPASTIILISGTGQPKTVKVLNPDEYSQIVPSPTKPTVAFMLHTLPKRNGAGAVLSTAMPTLRFFGVDGVLSAPITAPSTNCQIRWSANGQLYLESYSRVQGSNKMRAQWYLVNRRSMTVESTDPPADLAKFIPIKAPIVVSDLTAKTAVHKVGVEAPTVILTPESATGDAEFGVVTTDGKGGDLAPYETAVGFVSQGNAMVRPLAKVPLEAFRQAKLAALRTKLLTQAKQVGLALLMGCNDNGDNFPTNQGNWQAGLLQYSNDSNVFDGFNYTFGGGNASDIESPATTVLGYIDGPGGRAVVYTDGHAKWIPNP